MSNVSNGTIEISEKIFFCLSQRKKFLHIPRISWSFFQFIFPLSLLILPFFCNIYINLKRKSFFRQQYSDYYCKLPIHTCLVNILRIGWYFSIIFLLQLTRREFLPNGHLKIEIQFGESLELSAFWIIDLLLLRAAIDMII